MAELLNEEEKLARDQLATYYNDRVWNSVSNPGGFDGDGHRRNWIPMLRALARVTTAVARLIGDALDLRTRAETAATTASEKADAASLHAIAAAQDRARVDAAMAAISGGPVVSVNRRSGLVELSRADVPSPVRGASGAVTLADGETLLIKAQILVALPALPRLGAEVTLVNASALAATLDRNGQLIDGVADNRLLDMRSLTLRFVGDSLGWVPVAVL